MIKGLTLRLAFGPGPFGWRWQSEVQNDGPMVRHGAEHPTEREAALAAAELLSSWAMMLEQHAMEISPVPVRRAKR
jgi:hypothetical protein